MPQTVKIATCSYCGVRAALMLSKARHELTCAACGAPLHEMKFMPQLPTKEENPVGHIRPRTKRSAHKGAHYAGKPRRPKKYKKRKGFQHKLWEELWDAVEDIFD